MKPVEGNGVFSPDDVRFVAWPGLFAAAAFLLPLALYFYTLPPGLTWANNGTDAGDLITAACTLGVPHPPGYPTYTLIGWAFSKIPLGNMAWRFNLLSALSMAGAAWFVFSLVHRVTKSAQAGLVAAWSFAFTPLVWSQAIITEVYALNMLFAGLSLWLAMQIRRGRVAMIFWLGLSFGLALGAHLTVLFLTPLLAWWVYKGYRSAGGNFPRFWGALIAGLGVGLSVFAYLPLRAGRAPLTWGTPATWNGFWELVSGQIYRGYFFALPLSSLGPRLGALIGYLTQPGVLLLALAGIGLLWVGRCAKIDLWYLIISATLYVFYALGYKTADSYVYLLPVFMGLGLLVGLGMAELLNGGLPQSARRVMSIVIFVFLVGWGANNALRFDLRNDQTAEDFWQTAMSATPANAVLLTFEEKHTFTLWYAQYALGRRPDIAVVNPNLAAFPWHRADLQRAHPALTNIENLENLYRQGGPYHLPICAIAEAEKGNQWLVNCLK